MQERIITLATPVDTPATRIVDALAVVSLTSAVWAAFVAWLDTPTAHTTASADRR